MKRKIKLISFLIFVFVIVGALFYYYSRYEKIELPQEPDGIFSSPYTNKLAVIMDGKLTMYDETGRSRYIDTPFDISFAYPLEDSIYLVDNDGNLYEMMYKFYTEIPISDVILTDVKSFAYVSYPKEKTYSCGAVTTQGDLFVWGSNQDKLLGLYDVEYVETPTKVEYIKDIEKVFFGSESSMLLSRSGEVFEAGIVDYEYNEDRQILEPIYYTEFTLIEDIEKAVDISYGDTRMIFCDDKIIYWLENGYSYRVVDEEYEEKCSNINFKAFSQSLSYWMGITEEGDVYFRGIDIMRITNNPDRFINEPMLLDEVSGADAVYAGTTVAYVKKEHELIILKNYDRFKLWGYK